MKTFGLVLTLSLISILGFAAEEERDGLPEGFAGGAMGALIEARPGTLTVTKLHEVRSGDGKPLYEVIGTFTPSDRGDADKRVGEVLIFGRQTAKPKSFLDDLKIFVGARIPAVRKSFESRMVTAKGLVPGSNALAFLYYDSGGAR